MNNNSPFTVYNASAGSGKTFLLVKEFLATLFITKKEDYFKSLLAITFTNKAVVEMRTRIIDSLFHFSTAKREVLENDSLATEILNTTSLDSKQLQAKSASLLKYILNNYSLLSVETIDHFNHRLIRTFAKDLKLSQNFEVSLDMPLLLEQAVDQLISKAGADPEITEWLVGFALQKTELDKSWDIAFDLNKIAVLLLNENDRTALASLKGINLEEFKKLAETLKDEVSNNHLKIEGVSKEIMALFQQKGLEKNHFERGSLFNFFSRLALGAEPKSRDFDAAWQKHLGIKSLYPKRVSEAIAHEIELLVPKISKALTQIKKTYFDAQLAKNLLQNLIPLATVYLIQTELEEIKEAQNILPINQFNDIIYKEIKDQPAPFIYERLGERYHHFFIDEFQDTSQLQWANLQPLVENALVQQTYDKAPNSLLIVGDAKQAIYRWRGGLPEQFIALFGTENPFPSVEKTVINLAYNYRSASEIVHFNNQFFSFISSFLNNGTHKKIYLEGNQQVPKKENGGYVEIQFIEDGKKEQYFLEYVDQTAQKVIQLLGRGYSKESICILTRKKEEAIAISEALSKHSITVASEETLLLKNNVLVNGLITGLQWLDQPHSESIKLDFLAFIYEHLTLNIDKHVFFSGLIKTSVEAFEQQLATYGVLLSLSEMKSLSLYEITEQLLIGLGLTNLENPFVTKFLDGVFQFSKKTQNSVSHFLEYWQVEKERLSLSVGKLSAVSIMTIHKSKGLEFPVVIFPFAHQKMYYEIDPKVWFPYNEPPFTKLPIDAKKEIENYGVDGAHIYNSKKETLALDAINLLYVALTRSQTELYIISKKESVKDIPDSYAQLLISFLQKQSLWDETKDSFVFGTPISTVENHSEDTSLQNFAMFSNIPSEAGIHYVKRIASSKENQAALNFGNYFHEYMAQIVSKNDRDQVINSLALDTTIDPNIKGQLKTKLFETTNHSELQSYFNEEDSIFNERPIVTSQGVIRPDRINISTDKKVTIIDYKTGDKNTKDIAQIASYAEALRSMGFVAIKKLIVYVSSSEILVNKA